MLSGSFGGTNFTIGIIILTISPPSLIGIITVVTDEAFPMICRRFFSDICGKALGFRLWCLSSHTFCRLCF